jgi:competence protein ComEA
VRLKNLALTLLLAGGLAVPAMAQTPAAKPMTPAAPAAPMAATPAAPAPAMTRPPATATTSPPTTMPHSAMTNINTASAVDLDKLPQIGKARAKKIIDNRPYKTTDELVSKKVLSQGVYNKIKDKITAS